MSSSASPFTGLTLSGFCMQISILLKSAVPLYEGLKVMAEDSPGQDEREILSAMSDKVRMGLPFHQAVKEAGCFPPLCRQHDHARGTDRFIGYHDGTACRLL